MLKISRGDVISQGLNLAARPDLMADARLWLNLFLEEQYYNQDWNWLLKLKTGLAVVQGGTLPLDYRSAKSAKIKDTDNNLRDVMVIDDPAEWDDLRKNIGATVGTPSHMFIDHNTRTYSFVPEPKTGQTLELNYYHMPELPDHTDPNKDQQVPKWGLPAAILVDHIKFRAMEYNDDTRQDKADQRVSMKIAEGKMNNQDKRAGRSRLPLGNSFNRRWGGTQGSGGFNSGDR